MELSFRLNGEDLKMDLSGDERVLDILRDHIGLNGAREGCGSGECGACSILVDGKLKLACLMKSAQLQGRSVVTIEGLKDDPQYSPLFEAFASSGAVQCGYCTPGMIIASIALLKEVPSPSKEEVKIALSGNICRCTGYNSIVDAVLQGAEAMRQKYDSNS